MSANTLEMRSKMARAGHQNSTFGCQPANTASWSNRQLSVCFDVGNFIDPSIAGERPRWGLCATVYRERSGSDAILSRAFANGCFIASCHQANQFLRREGVWSSAIRARLWHSRQDFGFSINSNQLVGKHLEISGLPLATGK